MTDQHVDPIQQEYTRMRCAANYNKRQFVNAVDDRLRGERPRLERRDRCLRGLLGRYGWALVRETCLVVVLERTREKV